MLNRLRALVWPLIAVSPLLGFTALGLNISLSDSRTVPEEPLPFISVANDELLDQIFEEEKSDRIIRFIKNKKMKA